MGSQKIICQLHFNEAGRNKLKKKNGQLHKVVRFLLEVFKHRLDGNVRHALQDFTS